VRIGDREHLARWCEVPEPAIGICNYEKLIPGRLPELRYLGGLVLDESSILKTGGGTIKWNVIHSAKGIEYKLSCTATPAPNDTMEYASQAAFLEKLRSEGDILWTFFSRDKHGIWRVKPHARDAFYRFMASWSIYLRDPAHYGWADILASLPPPEIHEHRLPLTPAQREHMQALQVESGKGMFNDRLGVRERAKLSQLAKGFLYGEGKTVERVTSTKPWKVVELVGTETALGRPTIVWTVFDEESEILADLFDAHLPNVPVATLHGSHSPERRQEAIDAFKAGDVDVLVTKAALVGYGLNFQHCRAMVFSGFDDSFERLYQAIRRAYRFGQTETVHVHIPVIPELEGLMFDNLRRKQVAFDADTAEMEANYRQAVMETPA
jgi:helicase-like protein